MDRFDDDPNADLFGKNDEQESEEEIVQKQIYDKNPKRVAALADLWYGEMMTEINKMDMPDDAKQKMIFSMTANSILDMIGDAAPEDLAMDISFYFDMYLGVSMTNKRFKVDLFKEHQKALLGVKVSDFPDEETYQNALAEFEDSWWDLPQPLLEKRTPNDAIRETLSRCGLTE